MNPSQTFDKQRYPAELPSWSLKQIRDAIPARLHKRNTLKSFTYMARTLVLCTIFFVLGINIDSFFASPIVRASLGPISCTIARYITWAVYWWHQGLVFTGLWVLGHECGHVAFSESKIICHTVGWTLHSMLLTPYFSWKLSHHRHHSNHASIENDEPYVPKTRAQLRIPAHATDRDIKEILGDMPLYALFALVRQQIFGFNAYLIYNVSGQQKYPAWTNHFNPNSALYKRSDFWGVLASDVGMIVTLTILARACNSCGLANVLKHYTVPWILLNHWIVAITYLHHTDPILPHFRQGVWNFQRGASATIDRDILGWQGRFFLFDVAHYHVVHHFFPRMPWYNGEEATKYLREAVGSYYFRSSKPVFQTLWENYNFCQFVDDEGQVVYYRDREGKTVHEYDDKVENEE